MRRLLVSTVGEDEQYLLEHRTEPVVVDVYVDELMGDLGVWKAYDEAQQELERRYAALGIPRVTGVPGTPTFEQALAQLEPATEEQERQAEAIFELEDRLELLRMQDWAAYGQALMAHIEAAAAQVEGLRVPVVVNIDLDTFGLAEGKRLDDDIQDAGGKFVGGFIGLHPKTGRLLGWYIQHKPSRTPSLFGSIIRDAQESLEIPPAVTAKSLTKTLVMDGGFEDHQDQLRELFAVALPPEN